LSPGAFDPECIVTGTCNSRAFGLVVFCLTNNSCKDNFYLIFGIYGANFRQESTLVVKISIKFYFETIINARKRKKWSYITKSLEKMTTKKNRPLLPQVQIL
jgi:hypothetical protein